MFQLLLPLSAAQRTSAERAWSANLMNRFQLCILSSYKISVQHTAYIAYADVWKRQFVIQSLPADVFLSQSRHIHENM